MAKGIYLLCSSDESTSANTYQLPPIALRLQESLDFSPISAFPSTHTHPSHSPTPHRRPTSDAAPAFPHRACPQVPTPKYSSQHRVFQHRACPQVFVRAHARQGLYRGFPHQTWTIGVGETGVGDRPPACSAPCMFGERAINSGTGPRCRPTALPLG